MKIIIITLVVLQAKPRFRLVKFWSERVYTQFGRVKRRAKKAMDHKLAEVVVSFVEGTQAKKKNAILGFIKSVRATGSPTSGGGSIAEFDAMGVLVKNFMKSSSDSNQDDPDA